MTIVSQSQYAALRGVSRKTVTQWKQAGKLTISGGGIDVELSDAFLKKYRATGVTGNKSVKALPDDSDSALEHETLEAKVNQMMQTGGADMTLEEAKRVKENYLALLSQLDYDTKSGLVVLVSEVAEAVGKQFATVRTKLLAIPSEQAPRLSRLKTEAEVQDTMRELFTEAMEEMVYGAHAVTHHER